MTPFAEWLDRELSRRGSNRSKLAAAIGTKPQTISAWFNEDRIPSPEFCVRVADYFHKTHEEVLRIAGHLPPLPDHPAEQRSGYGLPAWADLIPSLTPEDAEYVGRLVESLARNPVRRGEESEREEP